MARAEFLATTRNLTAQRAGFRCSLPNCGKITVGPGAHPEKSVSLGKAAHIYAAAPKGPRGSGGLTDEELKSSTNAIWLCSDHADLVDKNCGMNYPPGLLVSYKALHEARIARELHGLFTRFGWIESLHVHSSPLFENSTRLEFGKLTLLIGNNGVGKSAMCEWLAAVSSDSYLKRWHRISVNRDRLDLKVQYFDPERHEARISYLTGSYPRYYLDKRFTAVPTAPTKVVFPVELSYNSADEEPNDLEVISRVLGLCEHQVLALSEEIPSNGTENVTRAWFQQDGNGYQLFADVTGTHPGLPFRGLSGSESIRVLMEFAILAASHLSEFYPTILIIDGGAWAVHTDWLIRYGEFLSSPTIGFQTLVSIPTRNLDLEQVQWVGWKVIRLVGTPPNVTTTEEVRN